MDGKLEMRLCILERNKVPEWIFVEYRNLFSILLISFSLILYYSRLSSRCRLFSWYVINQLKALFFMFIFSSFKIRIILSKLSDPSLMSRKTLVTGTCFIFP